jgi:putative membrane protein
MKNKIQFLTAVFALSACCFMVKAQSTTIGESDTKQRNNDERAQMSQATSNADERFVKEASKDGMKEVMMGNEGRSKASNMRVKNFSEMIVRDHTKANEELKSIAAKNKMTMPDKDDMDKHSMSDKTGASYDKEFMDMMVSDHKKAIDLFQNQSRNGNNPELKAFATRTLPILQMHLDSAMTIQESLR